MGCLPGCPAAALGMHVHLYLHPKPAFAASLHVSSTAAPAPWAPSLPFTSMAPSSFPPSFPEETTMEELCSWWLKLLLRPAVNTLLVGPLRL